MRGRMSVVCVSILMISKAELKVKTDVHNYGKKVQEATVRVSLLNTEGKPAQPCGWQRARLLRKAGPAGGAGSLAPGAAALVCGDP